MEYSDEDVDVIIIGAGIMGSCTAYELSKRRLKVILLEQFDFLHQRGSSHGESRTIRTTYPEGYYSGMVVESARLWEEAESEIGYRVYTKTPQFDMGPSDNKSLQSVIESCRSNSIPHRILDRRQVAEQFRGAFDIPDGWIGLSTEMGGIIRPTKAVSMFQTLAIRHGAHLMDHMEVVDIKKDGGGCGRIRVYTACGKMLSGRKCVVTVGAWMRKLVKTVIGLELPIQPLHTTICYWKIKEGLEGDFSLESGFPTFASYGDPYIYGTPASEFPGLIKIAVHGGYPCDPDRRTWATDMGLMQNALSPWIKKRFGGRVESGGPAFTQSCMYSMTPDGDFVIDFLGGEFGHDVVVAGGFSGHGFKMGPVVGRIVSDLVLDDEAQGVDLSYFRLGRFEENPKGNVKEFEDQVSSHVHP
ncbi:probable sarcosine oxidase [Magnolia sinica]|uniref:probable sarcosine oxidase n=1 Tax=Magnolia sinica TaxID=86752 RepID=UPI00265B5223|nr:probable sarcosine oxidase [Magnolia sinica]